MKNLMYAAIAIGASAITMSVQASTFLTGSVDGTISMTCDEGYLSTLDCDGELSASAMLF